MTNLTESGPVIACSFCTKPATEVAKMVAGPGVFICDECVALCAEIIADELGPGNEPARLRWERLQTDDKLLASLPRIAAGGSHVERQLALCVAEARSRGITWARIGGALGMTRQSAWERFSGEE